MALIKNRNEARKFLPEDNSSYHVRIVDVFDMESRNGNPMTKITYEVLEHDLKGGKLYDYFLENWIGIKKNLSLYKALSIGEDSCVDNDDLIGRIVQVKVKISDEDYNINIKGYYPPDQDFIAAEENPHRKGK